MRAVAAAARRTDERQQYAPFDHDLQRAHSGEDGARRGAAAEAGHRLDYGGLGAAAAVHGVVVHCGGWRARIASQ